MCQFPVQRNPINWTLKSTPCLWIMNPVHLVHCVLSIHRIPMKPLHKSCLLSSKLQFYTHNNNNNYTNNTSNSSYYNSSSTINSTGTIAMPSNNRTTILMRMPRMPWMDIIHSDRVEKKKDTINRNNWSNNNTKMNGRMTREWFDYSLKKVVLQQVRLIRSNFVRS